MVQKITLFGLLILMTNLVFADNENGEGKKSEKEDKAVRIDSVSGDTIYIEIDQTDDTLVFEDWDEPGKPTAEDQNIIPTEDDNDDPLKVNLGRGKVALRHDTEEQASFVIYPNPVSSELHIRSERNAENIVITGMSGEIILISEHVDVIDVRDYENGLYFIELIFNDHTETMKFIKTP